MQTDLVLSGRDGFDLNLSRYYSSAQAEYFGKSMYIADVIEPYTLLARCYYVKETIYNTKFQEIDYYYYFYDNLDDVNYRMREISGRKTNGQYYCYGEYQYCDEDTEFEIPYLKKSKVDVINYQRMTYDLGAGWSFAFPSLQLVRNDYKNMLEMLCKCLLSGGVARLKAYGIFYDLYADVLPLLHCEKLQHSAFDTIKSSVEYIERNSGKEFIVGYLAQMCLLSESRLFALFQRTIGCSPIAYRNNIRIRKAVNMLGCEYTI